MVTASAAESRQQRHPSPLACCESLFVWCGRCRHDGAVAVEERRVHRQSGLSAGVRDPRRARLESGAEREVRSRPAQLRDHHHLADLGDEVHRRDGPKTTWLSPLLFAPVRRALLAVAGRRISLAVWVLVVYLIVTYWAFTHRIDRFWMPLIPVAALLAGAGAAWSRSCAWIGDYRVAHCGAGGLVQLGLRGGGGFVDTTPSSDRQAARRTAECF